jgi:hypothetical protein
VVVVAAGGGSAAAATSWRTGGGADGVARRWVLLFCVESFSSACSSPTGNPLLHEILRFDRLSSVL